jgi:predicted N-acetyltransferase YhbS
MKFIIRDAAPEDSDKLIELTDLAPMKGIIGLRIDRKPDFFKLLKVGESYIALVAITNGNDIIGFFAAVKNTVCLSGHDRTAWYLRDLKVHPDHKGTSVGFRLAKAMLDRLKELHADILCCTVAQGNDLVVPFFEGRIGMPAFIKAADFNIYELLPVKNQKGPEKISKVNKTRLTGFFKDFFKRYKYYPQPLNSKMLNSHIDFADMDDENINAAISALDAEPYRQNVVTSYSWMIGAILLMLQFLRLFLPLAPLPRKNQPLKIIYAQWYAFAKGREKNFVKLLKELRRYAFQKSYHFVCIAIDVKDVQIVQLVKPMSRFVFKSSVMITSLENNYDLLNKIKDGLCYEDYAIV